MLQSPGGPAAASVEVHKTGIGRVITFESDSLPILPKGEYYERGSSLDPRDSSLRQATGWMKAIVQKRYGAPERVLELQDIDVPPVGEDEVLIRVRATSVNTPDWITVTGEPYVLRLRFGLRGPHTPVRGTDVAGVVEAVGKNVSGLGPETRCSGHPGPTRSPRRVRSRSSP